jgi:hypothetical protein
MLLCAMKDTLWQRVWAPCLGLALRQPLERWSLDLLERRMDKQSMVPLYIHIGNKIK